MEAYRYVSKRFYRSGVFPQKCSYNNKHAGMFRHVSACFHGSVITEIHGTSPSRLPAGEAAAAAEGLLRRPTSATKDTRYSRAVELL